MAHIIQSFLFAFASFFGVVALAVDRFLAIHFHLRYQELVTQKRVVAVPGCCSLLIVGVKCISVHSYVEMGSQKGFIHYACNDKRFLSYNFKFALLQNIRSRTTPQKSNSRPACASSRE